MNKLNVFILFLVFSFILLCNCKKNTINEDSSKGLIVDSTNIKVRTRVSEVKNCSKVFYHIETINKKPYVNKVESSHWLKIYPSQIYYYYPQEGDFYIITQKEKMLDSIYIIGEMTEDLSRSFALKKVNEEDYKLYVDDIYQGLFKDSMYTVKTETLLPQKIRNIKWLNYEETNRCGDMRFLLTQDQTIICLNEYNEEITYDVVDLEQINNGWIIYISNPVLYYLFEWIDESKMVASWTLVNILEDKSLRNLECGILVSS